LLEPEVVVTGAGWSVEVLEYAWDGGSVSRRAARETSATGVAEREGADEALEKADEAACGREASRCCCCSWSCCFWICCSRVGERREAR
jgi:hypothetical protein